MADKQKKLTLMMGERLHSKFKSVCADQDKTMASILIDLIETYVAREGMERFRIELPGEKDIAFVGMLIAESKEIRADSYHPGEDTEFHHRVYRTRRGKFILHSTRDLPDLRWVKVLDTPESLINSLRAEITQPETIDDILRQAALFDDSFEDPTAVWVE